ncbi:MAG: hypothetical protein H6739_07635 [Alphaproteobacteria bacterium]|nr:hypothetical protein [Alphaproteobacteria bacterium]
MNRVLLLLIPLTLACSGKDDASEGDDSACPSVACPGGGVLAAENSEATLPTCADVEARYADVRAAGAPCCGDEDCHILNGACDYGLGGCYEAVNVCVDQALINELGQLYAGHSEGCTGGVCDCMEPPSVACVEGSCVFSGR